MAKKRGSKGSSRGRVTKRKSPRKKAPARKPPGRPRGSGALRDVSTTALRAELERRSADLKARRAELVRELEAIDREIASLPDGGEPGPRRRPSPGRGRGGNRDRLEVWLARVLDGKTMGVSEVADAVREAGYKTTSPNFKTIVNQCLIKSELIRKVGHGKYTAA